MRVEAPKKPARRTKNREGALISKGQTLVNPVTGERMTFLATSTDADGDYVQIELRAEPEASVPAAHVHPRQVETFEIVSGTLGAKIAGKVSRRRQATSSSSSRARRTSGGTLARTSWSSSASFVLRERPGPT